MTVFKTFLKILNKNKFIVILYTVILIIFGAFNMKNSDSSTSFVASKPVIYIENNDVEEGITKSLISYMSHQSNVILLDKKDLDDALFYREVHYIISIPKNFRMDFLALKNPKIEIKSTKDYMATLANMQLERYLNVASLYLEFVTDEATLISMVEDTLALEVSTEVTSKLDTNQLSRAAFYYNFMNYSLLAGCVYIICLILSSFHEEKIQRRTMVSCIKQGKYNGKLLLANSLFAFVLWAIYILLGVILLGDVVFSKHGLLLTFSSFVFMICALTLAFFLSNLIRDKNAINGIVNVIALGSSFLCGAFVPMEYLPDMVLKIAHVLPSYYYIATNSLIIGLESFRFEEMQTIFVNLLILFLFSIAFIGASYWISYRKRKYGEG